MSNSQNKIILVTSGDPDGIGPEIIEKSFADMEIAANESFVVIGHKCNLKNAEVISGTDNSALSNLAENKLTYIESDTSPGHWVEWSAQLGLDGKISALVTAPLSKVGLRKAGFDDKGHTDIFRRLSPGKDLYMCFLGEKFFVSLVTDHLPLSSVSERLTQDKIITCAKLSRSLIQKIHPETRIEIGVLGLNPHSGEDGLLGEEEVDVIIPAIKKLETMHPGSFKGPLVPDVAFQSKQIDKYGLFIAMYHDQGLIPFKSLNPPHGGCQLTLGLDFIRTSVDHGTAKDIAGKGVADHRSFLSALKWARRLS